MNLGSFYPAGMPGSPNTAAFYPRAIAHVDADAFFAAIEQALEPALAGQAVVTGKERGIIACANYSAKARGVARGIPLFTARALCPDLVVLPSDYETYGLYSQRMFNIMRRYTPLVEEYSVDEAFLDLTGMHRYFRTSYEDIARRLQADIARELGITVSVGLSLSKGLAKLCSKFRKPDGFTAVPGHYIHLLLQRTPLAKVWGLGPNSVALLEKFGLRTAYDFVQQPEHWVRNLLHKPGHDIWRELRGNPVLKVATEAAAPRFSIVKSQTFTPPARNRAFVLARLMRNAESAFMKARRHRLRVAHVGVVLRHQDFHHSGREANLHRPTSSALEAAPSLHRLFDAVFEEGCEYRATLITLGGLASDAVEQLDLFADRLRSANLRRLTAAVDDINRRYGKYAVSSATSLYLGQKPAMPRDDQPERRTALSFKGETARRRLRIPRWNLKV